MTPAMSTVITDTEALKQACAAARKGSYVTVDTEFVRETTYWADLCLVQVAGEDVLFAVDALAPGLDMTPLYDLLRDHNVLKVFHAARQDIEIFYHLMKDMPEPLFDTQVAAMVCGFGESVGYETLVTHFTGVKLDKAQRFTDWSRRPLSPRQIAYALDDVVHLRTVYEKLDAILEKEGRHSWLDEEMAILLSPSTYVIEPEEAWRRVKARSRNRRFLAVVRAIAAWREREAQRRNVPRNRVIRDDLLLEMAAHPPQTVEKLAEMRGIGKRTAEGPEGAALLAAIKEAEELPESELPALDKDHDHRHGGPSPTGELLRLLLRIKGLEHRVATKLIATSSDLDLIAEKGDVDVPALKGWRREIFGADALALREGRIALAIRRGHLALLDLTDGATPPAAAEIES